MRKLAWVLPLLFLLTHCIRPEYDKQYVNLPESWRLEADEGTTACNFRWWEQFHDPVLDEMILVALRNNQDLKVAISRVLEFYARYRVVSAELYPFINGNASYLRTKNSIAFDPITPVPVGPTIPGLRRIDNNFQAFFSLNWELDFWGRVSGLSEAAYADLLSQVESRRSVVITVVTSVVNAYIVLRDLDSQLEVSKRTKESRLQSLRLARDRFKQGETSELEIKQAESEVEIAAIRVIEFERDIFKQENLLSILLGENPRSIERGNTIETFQYPLCIPTGLPSELLLRRPDIIGAEANLIALNARVTAARALFFPQVNLTGMYGSQSDHLRRLFTSPAEMWQYGFTAVQSIFNAGQTYYQVEAVKAERDEALFEYRQVILNAFREVNDALISSEKNQELVIEHTYQVQVLKDYLSLANLRYSEGEIDYLNVLDAERSLFDAQLQLVQAQADNFIAIVQLYSALGGGWVVDADSIALSPELCTNEEN